MREAQRLNAQWHSLLPRTDLGNLLCGSRSVAYEARIGNTAYGVAIYSQPIARSIARDPSTMELRRLAIGPNAPRNAASRMLAVTLRLMKQKYPAIRRVVSYLAVDVHSGTIYKAAGWRPVGPVVAHRPSRPKGSPQRATGPVQTTSRKQRWETEV